MTDNLCLRGLCSAPRGGRWCGFGRSVRLLFGSAFFLVRRQNQMQGVAFLAWPKFHQTSLIDIFDQTFQNLPAQTLPGHFASSKEDGRFDLISFIEEAEDVIFLGFVVVIVDVNTKLHFFDGDGLLLLLGLAFALLVLVQEFPVVHDAANRRLRGWGNFYQIQVPFAGHLERFEGRHDADLFAFVPDDANFPRPDTLIHADKTFVDTILRRLMLMAETDRKAA